ncbi:TetR/AcrR family transcriptional regulator [Thermovibrio ammonificans]|jgi:AcrR family transcriptional regulator|uniref:Transcriptional regulator, TetR family n=1 Tax=Thermovibrio ammonificans (strain DSM 15698 / JCM 12110 / HB-1) TaxID=648996 RepID=E8T6P1_THEA1|nr:TetR/AcrR family transcriptional regulator [Thermovibrio ammonificans]ADU96825.1 transcriptional regulator, TetR family [Thermovibrio ammonificans HB-1]
MRERIVEAAEKVFSEKGFYEAKVYQIADLAEVSVGTIYRFFKSKEELYAAVLKKKLTELERRVEKRTKHKSPEEAIKAYIETVVDFFDEERSFFEIFMREVGSLSIIDEERFELSEWYKGYVKKLARIVSRGERRGVFKELDPVGVILAISGAVKNLLYCSMKGFVNLSSDEIKKLLVELFFKGLLTSSFSEGKALVTSK